MISKVLRHVTMTRAWLLVVMALCLAVLVWDMVRTYAYHRQQTVERLSALARVVESRTDSIFRALDLILRENAAEWSAGGGTRLDDSMFLRARAVLFTEALTLSVVSPDGVIVHSSNPALIGANVGQRAYLEHFRAHPDDGNLFIAAPSVSVAGRPVVFVARAIVDPALGLQAVVVSGVDPRFLNEMLSAALPAESSGAVAILGPPGVLLARQPALAGDGRAAAQSLFQSHLGMGRFTDVLACTEGADGISRLLVLRSLEAYPLMVAVSVGEHEMWRPLAAALLADLLFLALVGAVVAVLGRFMGQRERLRLQAQGQVAAARDYYMRLLDHLPLHIWRSDPQGRIGYANATLRAFLGADGAALRSHAHPDDLAVLGEQMAPAAAAEPWEVEYRLRRHDGRYRWVHEIAQPFHRSDGGFDGHLGACLDITEMREYQEKLTSSNAELEQFAYVASHDLREPLRMISSYMGLIERRLGAEASADLREFLAFARDGATRMDRLILDLLQYSRIGRMSTPMRRLAMGECVEAALANLGVVLGDGGAMVCLGDLPDLVASEDDMVRLFQNLIGNAVKYARPGVPARITIDALPEAGAWRFCIADNGIGIAGDYFERIFRIFQRLHGRDDHGGGSGIGLAICRKIVENHGGRIWVRSDGPDRGSAFFFTLPTIGG